MCVCVCVCVCVTAQGIPEQFSGWNSWLLLLRTRVQSLVRELRFNNLPGVTKKKKKEQNDNKDLAEG